MGISDVFSNLLTEHLRKTFPTELIGISFLVPIGSYIQQEAQWYRLNPSLLEVEHPSLIQNFLIRYAGYRLEGRRDYQRTYLCHAYSAWHQSLFGSPTEAKCLFALIFYPTYLVLLFKSLYKPFVDIIRYREDSAMQILIQQITIRALSDPETDYIR